MFRGSLHRAYPGLVLAWIHVMRGLGRFELSVLMSSELAKLAASYDVIKVYGPRRLQLRMSSCLAQPRALPPKGVD